MISVIIPCYNSKAIVERSIACVLQQTYTDWELLLVDNNSTDNTLEVLKSYQHQYPEKIKVYQEHKKGAPATRNKGLQEAQGAWIQYLDADDEIGAKKLEHQMSLVRNSSYDLVVGAALIKNTTPGKETAEIRPVDTHIWRGLINSNLGITSANIWKTSMLRKVNGWDESMTSSQEYDLVFRLLQHGAKVLPDKEVLTTIHKAADSVSQSNKEEKLVRILKNKVDLRYRIKEYLQQKNLLDDELKQTLDVFIYTLLMHHMVKTPAYAKKELKKVNLDVPFDLMLKMKWTVFKKKYKLK